MPASIGVNLRVTGHCRQGGRKYMEDFFSVAYQQTEDERDLEYAFFGIYDGHGGAEAASFAKERLMETIVRHRNFWSDNDEDVLRAIKMGYIATHYAMWKEQDKWPKTASGLPSTAGTTASIAFIRHGKIYIGHVGDSAIVLGYQEPGSPEWKARPLTKDHKPECAMEMSRIQQCGGKVVAKSGVPRVVWNRPRIGHKGPVRRSTPIDEIPFLAVARSLGDLWSYNSELDAFVVSPDPDCMVVPIDTSTFRCLIFGTDGLFNMLTAQKAVSIVQAAETHNERAALSDVPKKHWLNPSKCLVEKALDLWSNTKMRADNTSVITLMLDPPGPPRAEVLRSIKKKNVPLTGLSIVTRFAENDGQDGHDDERKKEGLSATTEDESKDVTSTASEDARPKPVELEQRTETVEARVTRSTDSYATGKASDSDISTSSNSEVSSTGSDTSSMLEESIQINEVSSSSSEFFDSEAEAEGADDAEKRKLTRYQPFRVGKRVCRKRQLESAEEAPEAKRPKVSPEPAHNLRIRKMSVLESITKRSEELNYGRVTSTPVLGDKNDNGDHFRQMLRPLRKAKVSKVKKNLKEKIAQKLAEKKLLARVKRATRRKKTGLREKKAEPIADQNRMNKENHQASGKRLCRRLVAEVSEVVVVQKKSRKGKPETKSRMLRVGYLRKLRNHVVSRSKKK